MNKEVVDYIKKCKDIGQTDEQIKETLLSAGHKIEIDDIKNVGSLDLIFGIKKIWNWYLWLAITYSLLSIVNLIIVWLGIRASFDTNSYYKVYVLIWNILNISWFIFNIGIFASIFIKKIERRALLLPGLYIIKSFILILLTMAFGVFMTLIGINPLSMIYWSNLFGIFAPILLELIVLVFVIRFLTRKNVVNNANPKKMRWWLFFVPIILLLIIFIIPGLIYVSKVLKIENIEIGVQEKNNTHSPIRPILVKNLSNIQELNNLGFSTDGFYMSYQGVTIKDWKEGDVFTIYPDTPYFKDRDRVHYGIKILEGADSNSLVVYDNSFAKDKNRVYLSGMMVEYPQSLDVNTFERVDDKYFKDKNSVYFSSIIFNKKFNQSSYYQLDLMDGLDVDSFEPLGLGNNGRYYTDKNGIYFESHNASSLGEDIVSLDKITEADKNTFQVIGLCGFKGAFSYAKDKNYVYNGLNIVEGVDVATFELVGDFSEGAGVYCFTKDKNCIYNSNQKVLDANGVCISPSNCTKNNLASGCGLTKSSKEDNSQNVGVEKNLIQEESLIKDSIREFNLTRIQYLLEDYYSKYGKYPAISDNMPQTWSSLKSVLLNAGISPAGLDSVVMDPLYPAQDYGYYLLTANNYQFYILTARFENLNSEKLKNDLDGFVSGINCEDPIYCLRF